MRRLDNRYNNDISCDSIDPVAIGISWFGRWLNPYIVGHCYHFDIAQNHRSG